MKCGCNLVGVTEVRAILNKSGVLMFDLEVECLNPDCGARDSTLCLAAKTWDFAEVKYTAKLIKATPCCQEPCLNFVHFTADFYEYDSTVQVKLDHILFSTDIVSSTLRSGDSAERVAENLVAGTIQVKDLPAMRVFVFGNSLYTHDNPELYALRQAYKMLQARDANFGKVFQGCYEPEIKVRLVNGPVLWQKPRRQPNFTNPISLLASSSSVATPSRTVPVARFQVDRITAGMSSIPSAISSTTRRIALGEIFYTQDSIKRWFSDGRPLSLMNMELKLKTKTVADIQRIHVVQHMGEWFSLDNRRLYVFKDVFSASNPIIVDIKSKQDVERERHRRWEDKFTTSNRGRRISLR